MILRILLIILFAFSWELKLNAQPVIFHKVYPGAYGEFMWLQYQNFQTPDGGYLLGNRATLMKLDSNGVKSWRMEMNFTPNLLIAHFSISEDFNNGYLLAGAPMITSLSSNYNINWMKQVISSNNIANYSIKKTIDFAYLLGGGTSVNSVPVASLVKVDTNGNVLWAKVYLSVKNVDFIESMVYLDDGGILASATSQSQLNPGAYSDCVIFKTDSNGIVQWSKRYTSLNSSSQGTCIQKLNNGEFIVSGRKNLHRYLMKIDSIGNVLWNKSYATGINGNSKFVIVTDDGGYAMTGENVVAVPGGTGQTSVLLKTDSLGNLQWSRTLGGYGSVSSSHLMQTSDGGYAIAGRRAAINGDYPLNLIKTDSLGHTGGCLEDTLNVTVSNLNDTVMDFVLTDSVISVSTIPINLTFPLIGTEIDLCNFQGFDNPELSSLKFELHPNPNCGEFSVKYSLAKQVPGIVEIFDSRGREVFTQPLLPGSSAENIKLASTVTSGIYTCVFTCGELRINRRFSVIRE